MTKYSGLLADEDEYKFRRIEYRQRSTPPFIADVQESLVETFDEYRSPETVCDRLKQGLNHLHSGDVAGEELVIEQRTSKKADEYVHSTRTVAVLGRAGDQGRELSPGEKIGYVVVDDSKRSRERIQLATEASEYDVEFYAEQLLRAAESILSPLGWRQNDIVEYLPERTDATLATYSNE